MLITVGILSNDLGEVFEIHKKMRKEEICGELHHWEKGTNMNLGTVKLSDPHEQ